MEKEFIPYELALRMKQLHFDEPCFGYHYHINLEWGFFEGIYEEAELHCLTKLIEGVEK